MKFPKRISLLAAAGALIAAFGAASPPADAAAGSLSVPVEYRKLPNGLKVVLSRDTTSPKTVIAVYYNIGFRIEPKDRTGFAHLFEHMMFQGSQNLGKMEFIKLVQSNGGILNGSTRFDFTNYFEIVPSNTLETALWAEADRMKGLSITGDNLKNQQEVVKNEVKVNVLNRAYGGFPWLDLPQYANTNWYNAHNFYGDLKDLDAATLEDVKSFFTTYYSPNNAALVVVGDFDPKQANAVDRQVLRADPRGQAAAQARHLRAAAGEGEAGLEARRARDAAGARRSATTSPSATRRSTSRWGCSTRSSFRARTAASIRRSFRRRA